MYFLIFSSLVVLQISVALNLEEHFKLTDLGDGKDWIDDDNFFFDQPIFPRTDDLDPRDAQDVIEGDILLRTGSGDNGWSSQRGRKSLTVNLWRNGVIYYRFDKSVDEELKDIVHDAMKEWRKSSCLKFKECRNNDTCIIITSNAKSCSSHVGGLHGGQKLYLGKGCRKLNVVIHELGHSIGFFHEQGRLDRDNYIHINKHNVKKEKHKQFFKIMKDWDAEYDYSSIMHYHSTTFSIDHFKKNSMSTFNPHYQTLMGRSENLSFRDKFRVNNMYQCSSKCPNKMRCRNGGFLSPYKDNTKKCYCVCPPRIKGKYCEKIPENYEYYDVPSCSRNITEPTLIKTPGYPKRNRPPEKCSYWIQAPEGKKVKVKFEDFSFSPRFNGTDGDQKCYFERVEIRHKDNYDGDMYCGEDLKGKTMTATKGDFIIIINVEERANGRRGLKAKVTFV